MRLPSTLSIKHIAMVKKKNRIGDTILRRNKQGRDKKINLSHKLRCYIGIYGPKKSRNNTREKISYSFTCVDIANQLLTRHSPLAPLGQVDE